MTFEVIDLSVIISFYLPVLKAWKIFTIQREDFSPGTWLYKELLLHNPFLTNTMLSSASLDFNFYNYMILITGTSDVSAELT